MIDQVTKALDTVALKRMYDNDDGARRFFKEAAGRTNDVGFTTVNRIRQMAKVTQKEALTFCKALDKANAGKLLLGRRGAVSRMRWNFSLGEIGRYVSGDDSQPPEALEKDVVDDTGEQIGLIGADDEQIIINAADHRFPLRAGMTVVIRLPEDFNRREAERLANWLQTLPFVD